MSRRTSLHFLAALGVTAAALALAIATVGARPAQALPSYQTTCTGCHATPPSGSVTAAPGKTSLSPGESYTVQVAVGLTASGQAGYWISSNDAATPAVSQSGGPGNSPFTVNMTAPTQPGAYTYKVWGAKGRPSAGGMAASTTYQITVTSGAGGGAGGGAQAPTTRASGAVDNGWYKGPVAVDLTATDTGGPGVAFITYTLDGGTPVKVAGAAAHVAVSGDGTHVLQYAATDLSAKTETTHTLTFSIDGSKPRVAVLKSVKVRRGAKATIRYRVTDTPADGTAVTTIQVRNRAGKVVTTLRSTKRVDTVQSATFTCRLPKGAYRISATARDRAGNVSAVSATRKLTVR